MCQAQSQQISDRMVCRHLVSAITHPGKSEK